MDGHTQILPTRYRNPERIGHGGMGEIFRAEDEVVGRIVAVKVLAERFARDPDLRDRFTREALAAARLSGEPNTVTIFDVGEHGGRPFIVMEYLERGSIEARLRAGPPKREEALEWLDQAARALDAAHRHGVVHRDVKPGNLLLDKENSVRVADFGVASAAGLASLTVTGTVLGTVGYFSPEQAQGERATPASDRYALGVVAYELLAGRRPFEAESPTAEAAAHVHAEVPAISDETDVPRELDAVFERALAKDPSRRYESCAELVAAIRRALQPDTAEALPRFRRRASSRSPAPALVAAFILAAALAGAGLAAIVTNRGDEEGARERVVTRTLQGTTIRQTVTQKPAPEPPPPPPPATPPPPPPSSSSGVALTDQATNLLERGDYPGAERAARQAVAALQGSGELYEAYAEYDLGAALAGLGRCQEALPHLARSEAIQGSRADIRRVRASCAGR